MKRVHERRAAYNMTLPIKLMSQLDETLGRKQSRSGIIEHLIREYLPTLVPDKLYKYECLCGHAITTPVCRIRICSNCKMHEMNYCGEYTEN